MARSAGVKRYCNDQITIESFMAFNRESGLSIFCPRPFIGENDQLRYIETRFYRHLSAKRLLRFLRKSEAVDLPAIAELTSPVIVWALLSDILTRLRPRSRPHTIHQVTSKESESQKVLMKRSIFTLRPSSRLALLHAIGGKIALNHSKLKEKVENKPNETENHVD